MLCTSSSCTWVSWMTSTESPESASESLELVTYSLELGM